MKVYTAEDPYGLWIGPDGVVYPITQYCGHRYMVSYSRAEEDGWIAVTYHGDTFDIRMELKTVTEDGLAALIRVIRKTRNYTRFRIKDILLVKGLFGCGAEPIQNNTAELIAYVQALRDDMKKARREQRALLSNIPLDDRSLTN